MENNGNEGLNLLADVALDGGKMGQNGDNELEVKWQLEHPQSFVVKEIREMKNGKVVKSYEVRWFCSSHPSYNLYEPNEHNTSIESEGAMKADAPGVLRRFLEKEEREVVWKVKDIVAKETRRNEDGTEEEYFLVEWQGIKKVNWERRADLEKDPGVVELIEAFEREGMM